MLTLGSALPDISTASNLTHTMSGSLLSCYSLGNLASGILSGIAALYLGQKAAIVILSGLVCLGMGMLAFGGIPVILMLSCAIIGLGRGSMISFSQRTVNIFTNGDPKTTGMLHASFAAGAISAPLVFSALSVISWRAGLMLVSALGVIAVGIFASVRDYSRLEANDDGGRHSERSLAFLKEKGFMIISALMFLYLCCEFAVNGWLVTYMNHKNMTMNYSQGMAALLWVVILAGRLLCAWAAKYISQKNILLVSSLGSALAFGFMLRAEGEAVIAVSVACLGLCMAGISPIIYASSAPYTNEYPLAMGLLFTIGCAGGTIMPLLTGIIAEHWGFDGGMSAILVTFILLIAFALINRRG